MLEGIPMLVLCGLVAIVVVAIGLFIQSRWKMSHTPSRQRPPEQPTQEWLQREKENADDQTASR